MSGQEQDHDSVVYEEVEPRHQAWLEVSIDGERVGPDIVLISGPTRDVDAYLEGTMTLQQVSDKWMLDK